MSPGRDSEPTVKQFSGTLFLTGVLPRGSTQFDGRQGCMPTYCHVVVWVNAYFCRTKKT